MNRKSIGYLISLVVSITIAVNPNIVNWEDGITFVQLGIRCSFIIVSLIFFSVFVEKFFKDR